VKVAQIILRLVSSSVIAACLLGCERRPPAPTSAPVALRYHIEGMHCGSCAASITHSVSGIPGVRTCEVSFEGSSAVVTVDDAALNDRITEKVKALGFSIHRDDLPASDRQGS
jgi:copper chaperone CopZ